MSADPACPECRGSGSNRAGAFCEVCQIKRRGPLRTYEAKNVTITIGGESLPLQDDVVDALAFAFRVARVRERERPPEWLFRVWAMVDYPAGSGVTWTPEKRITPGKNALPIALDVITDTHENARACAMAVFRDAGHARWLVTRIQRMDQETEACRAVVREALEEARA